VVEEGEEEKMKLLLTEVEVQAAPVTEEEPASFDELFKLRADVMELVGDEDEEEEDEAGRPTQKKKKKKKKKFVELEYDPDKDVVVARKKRKRGVGEWDEVGNQKWQESRRRKHVPANMRWLS
jgi:N utilization substance protein A